MKKSMAFSAMPLVLAALMLAAAVLLSFCSCAKEDKPLVGADSGDVSGAAESASRQVPSVAESSVAESSVAESSVAEGSVAKSSVAEDSTAEDSAVAEGSTAEGYATAESSESSGAFEDKTEAALSKAAEALRGKTALFVGDSLCSALVYDKEHPRWGWAKRIERACGMEEVMNEAKDGASVSNCRGRNVVAVQLDIYEGDPIDFVILEGGGNDAWDVAEVGRVTPEGTEAFDLSTYAGGLEALFKKARDFYPDAHIGYVFNYRFHTETGRMADMTEYLAAAKEACAKWNMPMLNLYEDEEFNRACDTASELYSPDGIHLYSAGYDLIAPKIAEFMASLKS